MTQKIVNKIFISYSHKDEAWKDRLVKHLKVMEMDGALSVWDDKRLEIGSNWSNELVKAIKETDAVILLISSDFLTSHFIMNIEIPLLLERMGKDSLRILPLIIRPCPWNMLSWLATIQVAPRDGQPLANMGDSDIDRELASLVSAISYELEIKTKPSSSQFKVSFGKLPTTGKDLFGREREIDILDRAWQDGHTYIVWLTAWGGVGKTALINGWLNRLAEKDYGGAHKVYAWSFYSQGAAEGKQASADEFFQETLAWFNDPDPKAGSAVDKARRLVELIRQEKTLFILDGIEPLQYPPGEISGFAGRLKDPGLKVLLKELAASQPGLCLVSSREAPADLADRIGYTVIEMKLEELSADAGVQLLKSLGVTGADKEMKAAVKEYGGHALSLTLLGHYLHEVLDWDIRQRDKIPRLVDDQKKGPHARRVMAAYEKWLAGKPELNILRLMGLFDRPVDMVAIDALKAGAVIPSLTDQLINLSEADWHYCLGRLQDARLLASDKNHHKKILDCHPLIREYFAGRVKEENPSGWQAAHTRLYHYYKDLPGKYLPDTLPEMEPLFAAVSHGCAAGLHQQALEEVYWPRIRRKNEAYTVHKLGAFGSDIACLAHFFEIPWIKPATELTDSNKAHVLGWAAFGLRAVGRLREAIQTLHIVLKFLTQQENWKQSATIANNLSELLLILGRVDQAVDYAQESVEYAERSGGWEEKMIRRTTLADVLHQSGQSTEAERLFLEVEALQKKIQPDFPFLYSAQGFRFCDLLLSQGKYLEVVKRAEKTLELAKTNNWLLDIALDQLSLARAHLQKIKAEGGSDFSHITGYFDEAMTGLRMAGYQYYLPVGLFARAACFRLQGQYDRAQTDLDEALEIAELGKMDLYLVDYHLEAGLLCRAQGQSDQSRAHFLTAKELIQKTGYHRRDKEVEL